MDESFIDQGGVLYAFVWSLNTNEVREVAAMANFNLNKTQGKATRWIYLYRSKGWRPRSWEDVPRQPKTKSRSYKANGPKWR